MHTIAERLSLLWTVLPSVGLSMLLVAIVVRAILAAQWRLMIGAWPQRLDLVVLAHVLSLLVSGLLNDFVDPRAPDPGFLGSWLHSLGFLWPIQLVLLALDLGLRAGIARFRSRPAA